MLSFFKKKSLDVYGPVDGKMIPIEQVSDSVFSSKMMGEGFAIIPCSNQIFSPIEGTVKAIFPTKHAIALQTKEGLECLIHIGLDTVELNGGPFDISVHLEDKVKKGSMLATVDFQQIKDYGKETDVVIIFTNYQQIGESLSFKYKDDVKHSEIVGEIKLK